MKRVLVALLLALTGVVALPASAMALSAALVPEGGAAQPVTGATLRDPSPELVVTPANTNEFFTARVIAPNGKDAMDGAPCRNTALRREIFYYQGNGLYKVELQRHEANRGACGRPVGNAIVLPFTIDAQDRIAAPAQTLLTRKPGELVPIRYQFPIDLSPMIVHETYWGIGARANPDGSLSGATKSGVPLRTDRSTQVYFDTPGVYNVFIRGRHNGVYTPWNSVSVKAIAPWDIRRVLVLDGRGPSVRVAAYVGEATARGRVRIYIARGRKSGKYRRLGTVNIKRGRVTKRFRLPGRSGIYRLRYRFGGSDTVAAGYTVYKFRVTWRRF